MFNDKIKKITAACVTCILASGILLGGYYFYNEKFIKTPFNQALDDLSFVSTVSYEKINNIPHISVLFDPSQSLEKSFTKFLDIVSHKFKNNPITIKVVNKQNELYQVLTDSEFAIYEGIANGSYTQMLNNCEDIAKEYDVKLKIEMDENYIYWQVSKNGQFLQAIYSKNIQSVGVKVNNIIGDDG